MVQLVQDAQTNKTPVQMFADRVAAVFAPTVIIISLVSGRVVVMMMMMIIPCWCEEENDCPHTFTAPCIGLLLSFNDETPSKRPVR
jgi:cation transport ATPase